MLAVRGAPAYQLVLLIPGSDLHFYARATYEPNAFWFPGAAVAEGGAPDLPHLLTRPKARRVPQIPPPRFSTAFLFSTPVHGQSAPV